MGAVLCEVVLVGEWMCWVCVGVCVCVGGRMCRPAYVIRLGLTSGINNNGRN